jgi:hypothetical protein
VQFNPEIAMSKVMNFVGPVLVVVAGIWIAQLIPNPVAAAASYLKKA